MEPEKLTKAKLTIENYAKVDTHILQIMQNTWFCDAQDCRFPIKCVTYSKISDGCVKVPTDVARFTVPGAPIIHKIRFDKFQD